jgi:hypothetical protein
MSKHPQQRNSARFSDGKKVMGKDVAELLIAERPTLAAVIGATSRDRSRKRGAVVLIAAVGARRASPEEVEQRHEAMTD